MKPLCGKISHKSFTIINIIENIPKFSSRGTKVLSTSDIRSHMKYDAFTVIFCGVTVQEQYIFHPNSIYQSSFNTIVCHKVIIGISIL